MFSNVCGALRLRLEIIRTYLEVKQVGIYLLAVAAALLLAWLEPTTVELAPAINPLIGVMLFLTFLQVPVTEMKRAALEPRFLGALISANFVAVPFLVACILPLVPDQPLLRFGILLVLLSPCIDYVVTFAHLGKADSRSLLAATPVLLLIQVLLLPPLLGAFLGDSASGLVHWAPFLEAFFWLIAVPMLLAAMCQRWAARSRCGARFVTWLGVLPVPSTALVLFVVVAALAPQLGASLDVVRQVVPIYVGFALSAPVAGWAVARAWGLRAEKGRAVAFSAATRNSLVVLPLSLAIPGAIPVVPAVIITQTLIELVSELVYVKWLRRLA